ncbi:MAG: YqgE/AlgH family protein [Acidimicrobiia bacterium]|nr:YqgE/AlgH family protein [Acidimicrobiia bacterium]MDH3398984.1 YqgE/AlgH family protein [Acidimicrobiia bacterium]
MSENLTGRLLVAVPHMLDPNFARTVVLVCDHNEQGALGLIINRPTEAEVFEYLPGWIHLVGDPAVVFEGGPVQREVAVGLARTSDNHPIAGFTTISDSLGLLDLGSDPVGASGIDSVRVFSGYAGWEAGQLEGEIAAGGWFVIPLQPGDPFAVLTDGLWSETLARQGGRLAVYANFPLDPTLN